jgi:hypothetical protein
MGRKIDSMNKAGETQNLSFAVRIKDKNASIAGWRREAFAAHVAGLALHRARKYAAAVIQCRLAVERTLLASYEFENHDGPPIMDDLVTLAMRLSQPWTDTELRMLRMLEANAVDAGQQTRTRPSSMISKEKSGIWLSFVGMLLNRSPLTPTVKP